MLQKTPDPQVNGANQVLELRVDILPNAVNKAVIGSGIQNSDELSNNTADSGNNNLTPEDTDSNGIKRTRRSRGFLKKLSHDSKSEGKESNESGKKVNSEPRPPNSKNQLNGRHLNTTNNFAVRFLNIFRRKSEVNNFNVENETVKDAKNGGEVAVIRFEKIDPNLDANNNSGDVVEDKYAVEKKADGAVGGPNVKKKMDSDDDTRLINPRGPEEGEDGPEVETRFPNLINWWTWFAYSQGHVYNDLCASMWFTYLMPYLQKCVRLTPNNAGLLMLIGQVADALATPVIGLFSDRGSSAWYCGLGRRKTWHILGTWLVTLSFPFIFSPILPLFPMSSDTSYVLYYTPFICLFQFGWAAVQIAHLSLVPDLTPNDNERTSLLSVRYAFTVISNLLVYVIMYVAVGHTATPGEKSLGPSDSPKFQYISYIVVILGYVSTFVFYCGVSEIRNRQRQLDLRRASSSQMYESRKRSVGQLLRLPTLYTVAVLYMTARMFFNILQMFIVFYVEDTLLLSKVNIALVPLVILISGFITSLGVKQINVKLGRKWSHFIGLGLGLTVSLIVFFGLTEGFFKIYLVYLVAVLYGMSSTVIQVTSFGMAADFVGDDVSNGAFIYGILSFADKTSNGVVGFFIQHFNPEKGYYYRLALSYGCGLPCVLGIFALVFLTPLPQVKMKSTAAEGDRSPVRTGESEDEVDDDNTRSGALS